MKGLPNNQLDMAPYFAYYDILGRLQSVLLMPEPCIYSALILHFMC